MNPDERLTALHQFVACSIASLELFILTQRVQSPLQVNIEEASIRPLKKIFSKLRLQHYSEFVFDNFKFCSSLKNLASWCFEQKNITIFRVLLH